MAINFNFSASLLTSSKTRSIIPERAKESIACWSNFWFSTEVLTLIVAGKIDRDIAEILYIAPATVSVHVHAMLSKLEARDRSHAILIAQQQHLCDLPAP
jgi:DNA-binding CsgD family transcriptional regulator